MTIAPCPNCGGACLERYAFINGNLPGKNLDGWQVICPSCAYSGPACKTMDEAIRKHNKISQNCGVT